MFETAEFGGFDDEIEDNIMQNRKDLFRWTIVMSDHT